MNRLTAGIELGGTKVVCGLAGAAGVLLERVQLRTGEPARTLPEIKAVLEMFEAKHGRFDALGVASFGPLGLDRSRADFGRIGMSPKIAWRDLDLYAQLADWFDVPIVLDTDVNAAACAEAKWGRGQQRDPAVYITVGTGIGGGILVGGRPVHGLVHPEIGHIRCPRAPGDEFRGICDRHLDCIEGLACGAAIVARWGARIDELPAEHPGVLQAAHYLAHLVTTIILVVSPQIVILGGGAISTHELLSLIRGNVATLLNGHLSVDAILHGMESYIVPPALGSDAGVLGAIALAQDGGRDRRC